MCCLGHVCTVKTLPTADYPRLSQLLTESYSLSPGSFFQILEKPYLQVCTCFPVTFSISDFFPVVSTYTKTFMP